MTVRRGRFGSCCSSTSPTREVTLRARGSGRFPRGECTRSQRSDSIRRDPIDSPFAALLFATRAHAPKCEERRRANAWRSPIRRLDPTQAVIASVRTSSVMSADAAGTNTRQNRCPARVRESSARARRGSNVRPRLSPALSPALSLGLPKGAGPRRLAQKVRRTTPANRPTLAGALR
jgi:hypothetical protein